jgi:hypothetical protein
MARPLNLNFGCPVLDVFFKGGVSEFDLALPSMYGINANQSSFLLSYRADAGVCQEMTEVNPPTL